MTNLTDRMARIAWITHRDRQLAQLGMKPSEYAADIPIPDWAYTLADAVIAELGLRVQVAGPDGIAHGQHRYISDWITNE